MSKVGGLRLSLIGRERKEVSVGQRGPRPLVAGFSVNGSFWMFLSIAWNIKGSETIGGKFEHSEICLTQSFHEGCSEKTLAE